MYTLLHISDLHRSASEPVANETLVSSLLADRDRYVTETSAIPPPDAAIVTGDIVQGTRLGASGWAPELKAQYEVAHDFLALLADRMFAGDRRLVVVLPGNHDVCWNTARAAMELVPHDSEPEGIPEVLFRPTSRFRWSWRERAVFRVTNESQYRARLDAYWTFVERFYSGLTLPHPLQRDRGFNLFELAGGKIVVAAFESVHGNDCFGYQGAIDPAAIARCSLLLRDGAKPWQLRIAAWHHSVSGAPGGADFMDIQGVYEMIGNGFRLGLHGHQHLADTNAHYVNLPEQQMMAVVSAGSLCAGARELPRGTDRQYNVIALNNELSGARIHVREMQRGHHFGRSIRGTFAVSGFVDLEWGRARDAAGREIDPEATRARDLITRAEALLHANKPAEAHEILLGMATTSASFARQLRIEAARQAGHWADVVAVTISPESPDELVHRIEALLHLADFTQAHEALTQHADRLQLAPHVRAELETTIELRGAILPR